jgi:hypothetical protein
MASSGNGADWQKDNGREIDLRGRTPWSRLFSHEDQPDRDDNQNE